MTQVVNRINDLMSSDRDDNSDDSDNKHSVKPHSKRPSKLPKLLQYILYVFAIGLIVGCCLVGVNTLRQIPKAAVTVNPQGLTTAQYAVLQQMMAHQDIGSFFSADLQSMRDIVLGLPWVDQVSLVRDWQQGVVITVLPKQAVAKFGTERLVDAKGDVFVPVDEQALHQSHLVSLQGARSQAPVIMQQMQQVNDWYNPLGLTVVDIILTPRMTWLIRFDDGLRVIVDHENTAQKLLMLSNLLANQLSEQRDDIQSVDLRYKNGFTITWKPEALEAKAVHGQ